MSLARARNRTVLPLATLLAAALTVSPAHVRGSSRASGIAVAGGTVTSASGAAMAGQTVDLYAWPPDAVQKAMKPGQRVPTTLLAKAMTSRTGTYMLRVSAAKLKAATVESGYANLEIFSAAGGFRFFPYQTGSLPAHPSALVTVDFSPKKGPVCGKSVQGFTLFSSGFAFQRERKASWAVVGQGYIASQKKTSGDTVNFQYVRNMSQSQISTLGLGISGYGVDAGYNTSGSSVSTATEGVDYPNEPKSTWFRTLFSVGQYRTLCFVSVGVTVPHKKQHGACPRKYTDSLGNMHDVYKCLWLVKSTGWFGPSGSMVHPKHAPSTPGKFCGPVQAGIAVKTNKQKAIEWSSGFEIGGSTGIKGVTLKADFGSIAQTGYDTNAQMIFTFKHNGWICGTNHKPS